MLADGVPGVIRGVAELRVSSLLPRVIRRNGLDE